MRRHWLLAVLLSAGLARAATVPLAAAPAPDTALGGATTDAFAAAIARERQFRITAMAGLGGWAVANVAVGLPMTSAVDSPSARAFWQMNVYWNLVNLAIAGYGAWSALRLERTVRSPEALASERRALENFLWLNVGLDVAYLAAGWALLERGARPSPDESAARFTGFGRALLVQGAFLLLFDVTLLALAPSATDALTVGLVPSDTGATALVRWRF
jgi:hypothetical protein